jgi:predicted nucleic acid-binding protein
MAAQVFVEDEAALAAASTAGRALNAPHLIDLEVANVGLKKVRREGRPAANVAAALDAFAALAIERHAVDVAQVFALAERHALTAYDAAYLWLAQHLSAPLVTFDTRLGQAARTVLGRDDAR